MKKIFSIVFFLQITFFAVGQVSLDIGLEFQAYPTGILPGIRLEKNFAERHAIHLRVGANIFDHRNLGKHFTEKGSGSGFSVGYKRYFQPSHERWFVGVRSDIWFNKVDWTKDVALPPLSGTTTITVIQPTLETGFTFVKNQFYLSPNLAFGFEINTNTVGEATGEGAIVLLGLLAGIRF